MRGCLLSLPALAALSAAYYVFLAPYAENEPIRLAGAALGGLLALNLFSAIAGIFKAWRQTASLGGGQPQSISEWRDGETIAVSGTIRPIDAPLQAPFTGTPCVAYDYDLMHRARRNHEEIDIAGLALTPSTIDTPAGSVRLLSFALLDAFPRTAANNGLLQQRAAAYLASTTFKPMGIEKMFSAMSAMSEAVTDDDGRVRMDWRMTPGDIDLRRVQMRERLVTPGQQVTAVGIFSAERRGLLAHGIGSMIELRPGTAGDARRSIRRKAGAALVFGVLAILVTHGLGALYVYASRNHQAHRPAPAAAQPVERTGPAVPPR